MSSCSLFGVGGGGVGGSRRASYSRKSSSISFGSILAPSMTIFCGIKVVPFLFFSCPFHHRCRKMF